MDKQVLIPLDQIDHNPYQLRQTEDAAAVAEIAESIRRNGLMQIPSARKLNGRYQMAFGHTRLAAFKLNGEDCMPLIERELDDLQMFELGVAENIKRRDLNPIEQAEAMRRYMEEFGKTSVEAGEFFNVSEETVRGTVRLNDLNNEAKEKLASGKITVTMARTLLSLQKVAPKDVVVETLERLEKGTDRWGVKETPDEAIEEVMDDLDEVKELWSGNGKPRGGRHDAWLLDMKNFPNQFLPNLTAVDIAVALGIQENEGNEEALKLVDEYLQYVEAEAAEYPSGPNDKEYIASCRAQAKKRLDTLAKLNPDYTAGIQHLITPPACTACRFHTVVQGTHYCGMEVCFNRKTRAWEYEKLRAASKDLKIEIYNAEDDREFRVLEDTWNGDGKHFELFKKRSKDLRIALAVDIDRKKSQLGYSGVPSAAVVMVVGQTLKNLLTSGQKERAQKRSKQQAAELLQKLRAEKREALEWEVVGHVKTIFDGMNLPALEALWDAPMSRYGGGWEVHVHNMPERVKPAKDDKASVKEDFYRRIFAINMIRKIGGHHNKTISQYASRLSDTVKTWGVKLPKSIVKLATQMDEEITAVTAETEA